MLKCDVADEKQVKEAIAKTVATFGTIHVALACAGVMWGFATMTRNSGLDTKRYEQMIRINVFGTAYVARYAAQVMSKNKPVNKQKGVILFVSSVGAEENLRGGVAYGASKGALNGMVMPMARDLGRFGIRVVAVAPGIFDTQMAVGTSEAA